MLKPEEPNQGRFVLRLAHQKPSAADRSTALKKNIK